MGATRKMFKDLAVSSSRKIYKISDKDDIVLAVTFSHRLEHSTFAWFG